MALLAPELWAREIVFMRLGMIALCAAVMIGGHAYAFDPLAADVGGVRLHMDKDAVFAALSKRYGPGKQYKIEKDDRWIGKGQYLDRISYDDGVYTMDIVFSEQPPPNQTKEVVSRVSLFVDSDRPDSVAVENFYAAIIKKFGPPTATSKFFRKWGKWCANPAPRYYYLDHWVDEPDCDKADLYLYYNMEMNGTEFDSGLSLIDNRIDGEVFSYLEKMKSEKERGANPRP